MARPAAQLGATERLPTPLLASPPLGVPGAGMVSLKSLLQGPIKSPERRPKDLSTCKCPGGRASGRSRAGQSGWGSAPQRHRPASPMRTPSL
ncbi:hypothetical protein KIL84_001777 [Mauremys mutica]|uniref:Uncharacterized protein n=1 Tax=Mauremys mutica TaxID=74926 RepID=A0A9D3XJ32_9SAUR|nr:hypothetical protein KIL84_001777 [Mauremys mutica]